MFRVACADRYAQPGETVLHIGDPASWDVKARFDLALREGDELHPACPWPDDPSGWHAKGETWALYWHGQSLARIHLLDKALAGAEPFVVRIVRLGAGMRADRDRLIFAIYRATEHADG